MMYQKAFDVFTCVPHSTCLMFSHATACTAVSSTNSFPALSLPDPLSAEHQQNQSNHKQTHSLSPWHDCTYSYLRWRSPGTRGTACWQLWRLLNLHKKTYVCVCSCRPHFLVVLYTVTYQCEKTRPLIVLVWHTWRLSYMSKQVPPPICNSTDSLSSFTSHLIHRCFWIHVSTLYNLIFLHTCTSTDVFHGSL